MKGFQYNAFQDTAFQNDVLATVTIFPTVVVEAELDGHGLGWTGLTNDVLLSHGIMMRYGMDSGHPTSHVATTGTAQFSLNNSARNSAATLGYYSPHHTNTRTGWGLGIWVRLRLQDPTTLTFHTRFTGRIDSIDPVPGVKGPRAVLVTVVDWMDEAARWRLIPEVGQMTGVDWSAIATAIIGQMPTPPLAVSASGGTETYLYALDTSVVGQQTARGEFVKIADSEFGYIFMKGDGTLRLEDRHHRMIDTASAWTLTDADLVGLELPSSRDDIVNTVRVTTHPKIVDSAPTTVVYDQANVISFTAGETKMLMGSYRDPLTGDPIGATDIQPQVSGTDYIANTEPDGSGSNVSSGFFVDVAAGSSGARFEITNTTGASAHLRTLRLLGRGIYDYGLTIHEATDDPSIAEFGERVVNFDMHYQASDYIGQAAAEYILAKHKDGNEQAHSASVIGSTSALLTQILTREISDRIKVIETLTGVNADFFINGIEMTVMKERVMHARYTLAQALDPAVGPYFIIDTSAVNGPDVLAPF
jgi:hypothetical protein